MDKNKSRAATKKAGIIVLLMLAISIKVSGEEIITLENNRKETISLKLINTGNGFEKKLSGITTPEKFIAFYTDGAAYEAAELYEGRIRFREVNPGEGINGKLETINGEAEKAVTTVYPEKEQISGTKYVKSGNQRDSELEAAAIPGTYIRDLRINSGRAVCIVLLNGNTREIIKIQGSPELTEIINTHKQSGTSIEGCFLENKKAEGKEKKYKQYIAEELYAALERYSVNEQQGSSEKKEVHKDLYNICSDENKEENSIILQYLNILYERRFPLKGSENNQKCSEYNPSAYDWLDDNGLIAEYALTYLTNAVEYKLIKNQKLKQYVKENKRKPLYQDEKEKDSLRNKLKGKERLNGYPMPYAGEGNDTPYTFFLKLAADTGTQNTTLLRKYKAGNIPGIAAGTDGWGMLGGILNSTGYGKHIKALKKKGETYICEEINAGVSEEADTVTRLNPESLNSISVIVPDLREVKRGDILEFYNGQTKDYDAAVIVKVPESRDISAYPEQLQVVWMNREKGFAEKCPWNGLGETYGTGIIRRLLKSNMRGGKYSPPVWDIFDDTVDSADVNIGTKKESGQKNTEGNRWIPNTGEYLELSDIHVDMYNKSGRRISSGYYIKLAGAEDRDYGDGPETQENIYRNRAEAFEAAAYINGEYVRTGIIGSPEEKDGKRIYRFMEDEKSAGLKFETGSDGILINAGTYDGKGTGGKARICIRPESAEHAYPGDDLILRFAVYSKKSGVKTSEFETEEKDYIAVYDKKMLWRANLYIDEGAEDWNNMHPWNVPAEGTDGGPAWWNGDGTQTADQRWGNNEWNIPEEGYKGVAGGQLISIPSTKWYHGKNQEAGTGNRRAFNVSVQKEVKDAVAYDYQGWDSPKSYSEKLKVQKELMNLWYTANGTRFNIRVDDWPPSCDNFSSAGIFRKYLGDAAGKENDISKLKSLYKKYREHAENRWNGELNEKNYNEYVFAYNYGKVVSPYNTNSLSPQFFSESPEKPILKAKDGEAAYIPGLSNSIMYENSPHPSKEISPFVAGTDCIGFVQRSAAYGSKESTIYSALKNKTFFEPPAWNNNTLPENENEISAISDFHSTACAVKIGERITPKKTVKQKNSEGKSVEIDLFEAFKYAVPGDIVWYSGQHIMMISSISEPSGIDGLYLQEDVSVLESVYNNGFEDGSYKIYGCGKNRNLDVLNRKDKNWEIWRQK